MFKFRAGHRLSKFITKMIFNNGLTVDLQSKAKSGFHTNFKKNLKEPLIFYLNNALLK